MAMNAVGELFLNSSAGCGGGLGKLLGSVPRLGERRVPRQRLG
jgi:hypothetical protein